MSYDRMNTPELIGSLLGFGGARGVTLPALEALERMGIWGKTGSAGLLRVKRLREDFTIMSTFSDILIRPNAGRILAFAAGVGVGYSRR
jgi:hypothetical protein